MQCNLLHCLRVHQMGKKGAYHENAKSDAEGGKRGGVVCVEKHSGHRDDFGCCSRCIVVEDGSALFNPELLVTDATASNCLPSELT
jgi:hypothetical protein